MPFARLGATVLLVLATATLAVAQTPEAPDADEPPRAAAPPRIEIGGTAGVTVALPEAGFVASVPIHRDAAVELAVAVMPAIWDAPVHSLTQLQVRVPFRSDLRSAKSLVVGVTRIAALRRDEGFFGNAREFVRPHAGVSLQWPTAPNLDFRLDAQGVFTFDGELPLLPRASAGFVWHPRAADRANNRRTSR